MKKFWLSLGLTLILVGWGGGGYYGFGTSPSFGQDYNYCDPNVQSCYNNYYSAPYADPSSQFLYYVAPPPVYVAPPIIEERGRERGERRGPSQRGAERGERGHERR